MSQENKKVPFAELSAEELAKVADQLEAKQTDLNEKEKSLNTKSKELDKRENELAKKEASPKTIKPVPGLEFEFENEKYKFSDDAPKLISIQGKGYTQKEISENEELAMALIGGNSGLIYKTY